MTTVLDGKEVRKNLLSKIENGVQEIQKKGVNPTLAVVRVEGDDASESYEKAASKTMKKVGIETKSVTFDRGANLEDVSQAIKELNDDENVHGIIVMQPLPESISREDISPLLDPHKDVDSLNPSNLGKLISNEDDVLYPSTPKAVMEIIDYYDIELEGKDVTVVGASPVVGLPLVNMLVNEGATVSSTHIYTKDTSAYTSKSDIIVSATGALGLIKADFVKEGAIVIDVGFGYQDGEATGDVDYDDVYEKASMITPVPGGVGSVTTTVLASQVLRAAKIQTGNR